MIYKLDGLTPSCQQDGPSIGQLHLHQFMMMEMRVNLVKKHSVDQSGSGKCIL